LHVQSSDSFHPDRVDRTSFRCARQGVAMEWTDTGIVLVTRWRGWRELVH
jgi:hypothetical protein